MAKVSLLALACVAGLGLSGSLFAQSCTNPTPVNIPVAGTGTVDLCGGTNFVTKYCGTLNNASVDYAFSFVPAAGFTATGITLTNVSGGWTPEMVLQTTCGSITDCTGTQAVGSAATNTGTLLFSAAQTTVTAGTTYFLLVTNTGAVTCPTAESFSLAASGGTLPVKLSSFTID
jgi:hypothetical protein